MSNQKSWFPGHRWQRGSFFANLRVRPKFMVLHNLFFLVLAASVYLSLIPLIETRVAQDKGREVALLRRLFLEDQLQVSGLASYDYREGSAEQLEIPEQIVRWLELHPGQLQIDGEKHRMYRLVPGSGQFRSIRVPDVSYDEEVTRAKLTLFLVLGGLYLFAVLLLELWIMPTYVYRPIQRFLDADRAVQEGDRYAELIPTKEIHADEIGQIMESRNATILELRTQEARLENAMTELERKNELLEAARQSLVEQDRLASLGLLSASVAHELNTPMAVLLGSIEKMAETETNPATRERLARMKRVTLRLKRISEGLVDFARERRASNEAVDLRAIVEEAWQLVAIDEKASEVTFHNLVAPGSRATGNTDRLIQVFVNLLRNSLNAVSAGGQIWARSRTLWETERAWTVIAVEDDGPGIPEEVLPDIFEAFVTTRLDARGTGLGLTVADGIVTQHGGAITAANRKGGGALLEVKLPAA